MPSARTARPYTTPSITSLPVPPLERSSDEIIRILNLLADRIYNLQHARNEAEFKVARSWVLSSTKSREDIEAALDSTEFGSEKACLFQVYRRECIQGGSLDSDAITAMQKAQDSILKARSTAWRISAPETSISRKDLVRRENEKAAKEADQYLRDAIAAIKTCADGVTTLSTDAGERVVFKDSSRTVSVRGCTYDEIDPTAYAIFKAVYKALPRRITRKEILFKMKLNGKNVRRELNKLPAPLGAMIKSANSGLCFALS